MRGPISSAATGFRRLALAILVGCALAVPAHSAGRSLADVELDVARTHASVAQLSSTDFAAMIARGAPLAIFDARSDTEYRVSRIPGAARIAPDIAADRFIREHGAAVSGKAVVFYCSVGVRSSKLAERLSLALRERDALAVYNLAGGIFRWHNEGRALANDAGVTPFVHPFDKTWGKLLLRPELARYAPG